MTDASLSLDEPTRFSRFLCWFRSDLRGAFSLGFLALLILLSALSPWLAPY